MSNNLPRVKRTHLAAFVVHMMLKCSTIMRKDLRLDAPPEQLDELTEIFDEEFSREDEFGKDLDKNAEETISRIGIIKTEEIIEKFFMFARNYKLLEQVIACSKVYLEK